MNETEKPKWAVDPYDKATSLPIFLARQLHLKWARAMVPWYKNISRECLATLLEEPDLPRRVISVRILSRVELEEIWHKKRISVSYAES